MMKVEKLMEEEFKRLEEQFASAVNFALRMSSGGSEIGKKGRREIQEARIELFRLFNNFSRKVVELAKEDMNSSEHKDATAQKAIDNPKEVAKIIFERFFRELEKL